jgi:hypothetical protein
MGGTLSWVSFSEEKTLALYSNTVTEYHKRKSRRPANTPEEFGGAKE